MPNLLSFRFRPNRFHEVFRNFVINISLEEGHRFADTIHNRGRATVWTGPREPAELYWEQLKQAGLTMAPLEQH